MSFLHGNSRGVLKVSVAVVWIIATITEDLYGKYSILQTAK